MSQNSSGNEHVRNQFNTWQVLSINKNIVEKDKVPVYVKIQWPPSVSELLFEVFRSSLSSALVSYISMQTTDICQPAPISVTLTLPFWQEGGEKKALTSPISSFFHSPSHQMDCQSLIDSSCRFLPLTPIFQITDIQLQIQIKQKGWRYIINTQRYLFVNQK